MNILLLGGGGREHALAWKIKQSTLCKNLFVAPGNAGTHGIATNLPFKEGDFNAVKNACITHQIDMVVVGPEPPLVDGIVDFFKADGQLQHIPVIGPDKAGAQLEGSKDFSKKIMAECGIPTARYATFTRENLDAGIAYLQDHPTPVVLKADGLAAGKGVLICSTREEAITELQAMISDHKFGDASAKVVVEEFLDGIELSVFVVTDGVNYRLLPSAKDYKRIGVGDTGLNTGGMGAVSPVPFATPDFLDKVEQKVVSPLLKGLQKNNIRYKGFLFVGLMKVGDEPFVIEFNCRLGDPETEVVLPRLKTDLVEIFLGIANETLDKIEINVSDETAVTVFLVSGGYPGDYEKGKLITGFDQAGESLVFHAGTARNNDTVVTSGGRVMAITSFGNTIGAAASKSMAAASKINFDGKYYRNDIGNDLITISQ
jgi:phosphoribosylamine--glycine ligase